MSGQEKKECFDKICKSFYEEIKDPETKKNLAYYMRQFRLCQLKDTGFKELDLHGLTWKNAEIVLEAAEDCINKSRNSHVDRESFEVKVITGWGKHSPNNKPSLFPKLKNKLEKDKIDSSPGGVGHVFVYFK